jgi:hypothetical protein
MTRSTYDSIRRLNNPLLAAKRAPKGTPTTHKAASFAPPWAFTMPHTQKTQLRLAPQAVTRDATCRTPPRGIRGVYPLTTIWG